MRSSVGIRTVNVRITACSIVGSEAFRGSRGTAMRCGGNGSSVRLQIRYSPADQRPAGRGSILMIEGAVPGALGVQIRIPKLDPC